MQKKIFRAALLVSFAATACMAFGQGMPTTQPKFLHIYREQVKFGRNADHSRWESGWPAAFEKTKSPYTYIGLEAVTGPREVWYVVPLASQAAWGEMNASEQGDATLSAELDRLTRGDAEFVSDANALQAVARPELSYGAYPDIAKQRFWEISIFRVKPGYNSAFAAAAKAWASASARSAPGASWRTYEVVAGAADGTYLVFSSVGSFGDFDKALSESDATYAALTFDERTALQKYSTEGAISTVTNRYRLDPAQSYVPAETRQKDPAFWLPKATKTTKAPAKKP